MKQWLSSSLPLPLSCIAGFAGWELHTLSLRTCWSGSVPSEVLQLSIRRLIG